MKTLNFTLAVTIAALGLAACQSAQAQNDPRTLTPRVELATVHRAGPAECAFTGVITARVQSNLGFRVPGKVVERLVNTGDFVHLGQPLMRIDPTDLALAIAAQTAAVASAKAHEVETAANEARYRALISEGAVSKQEYDQAKEAEDTARAALAAAKARAQVARDEGEYSVLIADADGIVVETLAEPGQVVATGQTVVKLAHSGPREATVNLPETIHPPLGSMVQASLYGGVDKQSPARLRQLSDAADPSTRTYEAKYVLGGEAANAPLGATVTIQIPESANSDSMQVPLASITDRGRGPGVWLLNKNTSTVSFRSVKVLRADNEDATVADGLQPGEEIVALGAHLLSDGQRVRVADNKAAIR